MFALNAYFGSLLVFLNDGFQTSIELLSKGCDGYEQQVWVANTSLSHLLSPWTWYISVCSDLILKSVPLSMVCIFVFS